MGTSMTSLWDLGRLFTKGLFLVVRLAAES